MIEQRPSLQLEENSTLEGNDEETPEMELYASPTSDELITGCKALQQ